MPVRPARPCPRAGCSSLQPCPHHPQVRQREVGRPTAAQRGYDAHHRRWRAVVLAEHPVCVDPYRRHPGRVVPSVVADHIVPLNAGGDWSLANGQGLCLSCHGEKSRREREGGGGSKS